MLELEYVAGTIMFVGSILGIVVMFITIYDRIVSERRKEWLIKTIKEAVRRERLYLKWNCKVDIKDFEGHTEEINEVTFVNLKDTPVRSTWHHIWGSENFFKSLVLEAYELNGNKRGNKLEVKPMVAEPSHWRIMIRFGKEILPFKSYSYVWIQKYIQFEKLKEGEWYEFQVDSLIRELKIQIYFPPNSVLTSTPACYTLENGEVIPYAELKVKMKGKRPYIELKVKEWSANKILRFLFSAKPQ
jgi:hypothetical protein